jgi:hypothetical protein
VDQEIIYFYLPSDTLVFSALPIIEQLKDRGVPYQIIVPAFNESADEALEKLDEEFLKFSHAVLPETGSGKLILFNDWDKTARYVILLFRRLGIPSICIQESMIDFFSKDRMMFADHVILQSEFYRSLLARDHVTVIGNPRYESIERQTHDDLTNRVMINCNFTYGIYENIRIQWLEEVVNTLNEKDLHFFISKHPRDVSDISELGNVVLSDASSIANQLSEASLLISRFSSVIHEAILSGIPVIYYNPHNESMIRNICVDDVVVKVASDRTELAHCINHFTQSLPSKDDFNEYIQFAISANRNAAELITEKVMTLKLSPSKISIKDRFKMLYFNPAIRQLSRQIRKILRWG